MRGIFIVAGHGLSASRTIDNGASGNGTTERKEVVEMSSDLYWRLVNDGNFAGIEVLAIGVADRLTLREKIDQINALCRQRGWGPEDCILLSLHVNAAGTSEVRGLEAWYSREEGTMNLARSLVEHVARTTGLPIRRYPTRTTDQIRQGRLGIIDDTIPKGVLFEAGFISNEFDAAFIKNAQLDDQFANGMHTAVREFIGFSAASAAAPLDFFRDVPSDAWYHDDVRLCLQEGLFQMQSDGLFHPDAPVTRAELAAVMARHLRRRHELS